MRYARAAFVLFFVAVLMHPAAGDTFRAGYAKRDVTPENPVPMGGYGARGDALSEGVRDPLYAKALVIEAGGERLALVGLDMGRPPMTHSMNAIMEAVAEKSVEHVMIVASHTHHGPQTTLLDKPGMGQGTFDDAVAYTQSLEDSIIEVIGEAVENLEEARIGWATQDIDMNRNRHSDYEPKPRDPELAVVRFDNMDGEPIAIMVNFAAHPTMHPVDDLRISAEWPGAMMTAVETETGIDCFFMQGAAGDLTVRRPPGVDGIDGFGQALAEKVIAMAETIETHAPEEPSIQAVMKRYELDSRVPLQDENVINMYRQAFFPEFVNASLTEFEDGKIRPVMTVALLNGEVALVGGSGEFFSAHSVRLKERFRGALTLFFGYCNGSHLYFPTIEGAAEGGYGAGPQVAWVEVGAPEKLMNDALILLYQMRGDLD